MLVEQGMNSYALVPTAHKIKPDFVGWTERLLHQAAAANEETARPKLLVDKDVASRFHQVILPQRQWMHVLDVLVVEVLGEDDFEWIRDDLGVGHSEHDTILRPEIMEA